MDLFLFIGKLHPLVIHFPIVFIFIFSYCLFFNKDKKITNTFLLLSIFSTVLAIIFGLFNIKYQSFTGDLKQVLNLHQIFGYAVLIVLIFIYLFQNKFIQKSLFLKTISIIIVLLVSLTAHQGGVLVQGTDYFSEVFTKKKDINLPLNSLEISYSNHIKPIFEAKCSKCHMNGKKKGKFQMDTLDLMLKSGESGNFGIVPGSSADSEIVKLIKGLDKERIMPKKGIKVTQEEIELISNWIDVGAKTDTVEKEVKTIARKSALLEPITLELNKKINPIDHIISKYYAQNNIGIPDLIDDNSFIRKAYLDVIGLLPLKNEVENFISNTSINKRDELIKGLLNNHLDYAHHWMTFWNDLLRNAYTGPGFLHGNRKEITFWLHSALLNNKPYNTFASELIDPNRLSDGFTRGILWWKNTEEANPIEHPAMQAAQNVSQVFLGVNLKCASCHDSFTDSWTLQESYALANVFAKNPLQMHECAEPIGEHPKASFLFPEVGEITTDPESDFNKKEVQDLFNDLNIQESALLKENLKKRARSIRVNQIASLITNRKNGRFLNNIVNRYFDRLIGIGLIPNVDELDFDAWSLELLTYLSNYLKENNYDLKKLIYLIVSSDLYQSAPSNSTEKIDNNFIFKGPLTKRISVEVLFDSLNNLSNNLVKFNFNEFKRISRVIFKDFNKESRYYSKNSINKRSTLKYVSDTISNQNITKIDIDIKGAKKLWLIAYPKYKLKSSLEILQIKHNKTINREKENSNKKQAVTNKDLDREKKNDLIVQDNVYLVLENAYLKSNKNLKISNLKPTQLVHYDGGFYINDSFLGIHPDLEKFRGKDNIALSPFSLIEYDLTQINAERFISSIKLNKKLKKRQGVVFMVMTDFNARAVFKENNHTMKTLGRPSREQVLSKRNTIASTMEAIEFNNNKEINDLVQKVANRIYKDIKSKDEVINYLYLSLLSRLPNENEKQVINEFLGKQLTELSIADIIWSIVIQPEFQFS